MRRKNRKRRKEDIQYFQFKIEQANFRRIKAEAELAELKLKVFKQEKSFE